LEEGEAKMREVTKQNRSFELAKTKAHIYIGVNTNAS
jgi:hypothetical protein